MYVVWILPVLGLISFVFLFSNLKKRSEIKLFIWSLMVFLSAYPALQSAIFPSAILPGVSGYEAASQSEALSFALWVVALILPVLLGYIFSAIGYFRAKSFMGKDMNNGFQ